MQELFTSSTQSRGNGGSLGPLALGGVSVTGGSYEPYEQGLRDADVLQFRPRQLAEAEEPLGGHRGGGCPFLGLLLRNLN